MTNTSISTAWDLVGLISLDPDCDLVTDLIAAANLYISPQPSEMADSARLAALREQFGELLTSQKRWVENFEHYLERSPSLSSEQRRVVSDIETDVAKKKAANHPVPVGIARLRKELSKAR